MATTAVSKKSKTTPAQAAEKRVTDHTKFQFGDMVLNKRKLALNVIKDYASNHPDATSKDLQSAFPGMLKEAKTANDRHFFIGKENEIKTKDRKRLRIWNQMTGERINNLIQSAEKADARYKGKIKPVASATK